MDLTDSLLKRALTDSETGLSNRHAFRLEMERTFERAQRYGFPISILTFRWNHGDTDIPSKLARRFASAVRSSDCLARTGERELRLLLTHDDADQAERVADRLGRLCQDFDALCPDGLRIETRLQSEPEREQFRQLLDEV